MSWVRAAFALYGATLAVAIAPALQHRAQPGDLPSGITALGLDSSGPLRQLALIVVMAFAFAAVASLLMRFIVERRWAMWTSTIALASAPITLMHFGNARHLLLHGVVAAAVIAVRRVDVRFSRADAVLVPVVLSFHFAFVDLDFGHTPAATFLRAAIVTLALRIAVGAMARLPRPGYAFAAAPLAFLAQMQWMPQRAAGIIAVLWLVITPLALARTVNEARLRRFATWIAYPIAVAAYVLALISIAEPIHIDFFEDGHDLQAANELLRGKRPYRDIVPIHGFLSDGGFGWLVTKLGGDSAGAVLKTRLVMASLTVAAIYFVALAASGSAEAALLAAFLAYALLPIYTVWSRPLFPLVALACAIASVRLRSARWMIAAGAALVPAALFSLDMAAYSAIVALVAALRARFLKQLAIGAAVAAVPVLLVFTIGGFLIDAFRVTVAEVLTIRSAVIAPLAVPDCFRSLGAFMAMLTDRNSISFIAWTIALIGSAAMLTRKPRRGDAVWLTGLWIVVACISYARRQELYFDFAVAAFLVSLLFIFRRRQAAVVLAIVLVLVATPFDHLFNMATPLRQTRGLQRTTFRPFGGSRRAAGAIFDGPTVTALETTQRFLATLKPDDTFADFANAGLLYYLFERETPIRYNSVMMYESEAAQRQVIDTLERRRVAAALIAFPGALTNVDGVPNRVRAPLVWQYLQAHYAPALEENGVVFWRRRG